MNSVRQSTPAHLAWLLPAWTLFLFAGILLGRPLPHWQPLAAALALTIPGACFTRRHFRACALLLTAFSFGALIGWITFHPVLPEEGEYTVCATVVQEIDLREDGQVQTVLSSVTLNGVPQPDAHWTFYLDEEELLPDWLVPGAGVQMQARLYHPRGRDNPGGFDFRDYLLQRGIRIGLYGAEEMAHADTPPSLRGQLASLRHHLSNRLMDVMGRDAGAYAAAMLLGTRDFIPEDDIAAFSDLGIAHILSISGFHVGVLIGILQFLLKPACASRSLRLLLEACLLCFYCILTGGHAPVIRASLLFLMYQYTRLRHRQPLPLHFLCAAACIQLILHPASACSCSFHLTYGAMLGLTLIFPWLKKQRTWRTHAGTALWDAFCAMLSAQAGVLFPLLYWFGELPLLSLVLNMFITVLAGMLITLYWGTLAALPIPVVREALGSLSALATQALLTLIRAFSALDVTSVWTRRADLFTLAGWMLLIFSCSALFPRRARHRRKWLLLSACMLIAVLLVPLPESSTSYIQLSVGDGDAAVLQDRDMTVVIDAGEDGRAVADHLHQRRQGIELLILTHLHTDHAGGLQALLDADIPIACCCLPVGACIPTIDAGLLPLLEELAATGTRFSALSRGDTIDLPSGRLTVLWPEKDRVFAQHNANDACLVLRADIAGVSLLCTSDLTGAYEKYVQLPCDILKIAHHGSAESTSEAFLAAVDPQVLLQSNADEARDQRIAAMAGSTPLYTTEKHGGITIHFLGDGVFTVETVNGR